ncbi:NAD(P)/FAD-dependent oxidoreductase [Roseomonas sp. CCTCC AB2023176]|uniref:NAD(P)/FAD-dependent oxidoreductase n=1 Tax=Roseomonas sp. CCTCC AB2023176 TaxID=3342640 RepID=UPI0035DDD748
MLRHAARLHARGHAVTCVAPNPFWYSGLATGVLNGERAPAEDQVDVAALCARHGVRFVQAELMALDRPARRTHLTDGTTEPYDVLSLALGSRIEAPPFEGPGIFPAKPIASLLALRPHLEAIFAGGSPARVVVAGSGVTGCEIAASVAGLATRRRARAEVTVLGGPPLRQWPDRIARRVTRLLTDRGVAFRPGHLIAAAHGTAQIDTGALPYDALVLATGLRPPPVLRALDLPLSPDGALTVDAHLRSPADPRVHGAGDCIAFEGEPLPRAGVFAVRQAPTLLHNLLAVAEGTPARRYRPRRPYLWIMNLGDGTGFAGVGPLHWHGRSALALKDRLDLSFLRRHSA